ncbi:MAG: ribosome-associated translation inhibitor RaiA [Alphaproteobacteria bacterium]|nr:ribosome-associated translation inhibitor RaiA [Alphaproteobacteria bacterium]OJV46783.1 MAG: ribosomal subunit interface protein [Alphaproteobacteria bacterium 43-37]
MQLTISGKNLNIGDSLRDYIRQSLNNTTEKYFHNPIEATVIVSKESSHFRCDMSIHIGKGIVIRCHAMDDDPYVCIDLTVEKVGKTLRRHKNRLRDHHKPEAESIEETTIKQVVYSGDESDHDSTNNPIVIAEMATKILPMTVSEAIMRLDITDQQLLMFKNNANGQLNVVFRRQDGNIGWIDPSLAR